MTYGEIYDEILLNCFAGAVVPENMPVPIRKKIASCQRMLNRDYNFWFTLSLGSLDTVAGTQSYTLAGLTTAGINDFKEIEKVWFMVDGQTYGTPVLSQMDIADHLDRGLQTNSETAEYPSQFRIDGQYIYFYPIPSEVRTAKFLYWRFLPIVPVLGTAVDAVFSAYEDDISRYCAECIIFYVTAQIKLQQDEWQSQQIYMQYFNVALEGAMMEDKARRSIPETVAPRVSNGNSSLL